MSFSVKSRLSLSVLTLAALSFSGAAHAADDMNVDVYAKIGAPGFVLGLSHRYDERFSARIDVATIGSIQRNGVRDGIDYNGKLKSNRVGVFGDWYPFAGSFRLTGGLTYNDAALDLAMKGAGQQLTVGGVTKTTDSSDYFNVSVKYPTVMPYVGIGWGHHQPDGRGLTFDFGASIGKPTVTENHGGNNLGTIAQSEYDTQLKPLRDNVSKVPGLPQLTLGLTWRF